MSGARESLTDRRSQPRLKLRIPTPDFDQLPNQQARHSGNSEVKHMIGLMDRALLDLYRDLGNVSR